MSTTVLDGRYRLVERIATGGMGEVWRAEDALLARQVAVKLLRSHIAGEAIFRERFRNEARITAGLTEPGIAQIYDYGEQEDVAYLVMELIAGDALSAVLARTGPLSTEVTLDVITQSAKALYAAHRRGIVHRDIKPGNILLTGPGQVKITDFGIARVLESAGSLTQAGTVMGTAQYCSPEQASGNTLTPSSDIYSLGIVAYECLTGRPPFDGQTPLSVALAHLREPPPPLPSAVPPQVTDLILAMLAKDPADRPANARELADRAYVLRDALVNIAPVPSALDDALDDTGNLERHEGVVSLDAGRGAATAVVSVEKDSVSGAGRRRTSLVLVTTVGLAVFILGVIMIGAFTGGSNRAGLTRDGDRGETLPSAGPALPPVGPTPATSAGPAVIAPGVTSPRVTARPTQLKDTPPASATPRSSQTPTPPVNNTPSPTITPTSGVKAVEG